VKIWIAGEDAFAAHLLTGSHAATAEDAKAVIAVKEGLSQNWQVLKRDLISDVLKSNELHCLLQLAFAVLGAVLAAYCHRELAHALAQVIAFASPFAKEAAGGMIGECQEHLQGVSSHLLQLLCPGLYHHSLFRLGIAGSRIVIQAFYGDDAQLAGANGLEVWVVAKCWYIRARFSSCIENGSSLWDHYLSIIDGQSNFKHVPNRAGHCRGLIVLEGCSERKILLIFKGRVAGWNLLIKTRNRTQKSLGSSSQAKRGSVSPSIRMISQKRS
jgi:hypothetical protein